MGDVVYGATEHLAETVLKRLGINMVEVDTSDLNAVEAVLKANPRAKAILFETPTNPMLAVHATSRPSPSWSRASTPR